jgi:carbamoyltransferase
MNIVSLYTHHDSTISLSLDGAIFNLELERLLRFRYISILRWRLDRFEECLVEALECMRRVWPVPEVFDLCVVDHKVSTVGPYFECIRRLVPAETYSSQHHHHSHAANAFYQCPYDQALIFSYDGIGSDGCFNVYLGRQWEITRVKSIGHPSLGFLYRDVALALAEIHKNPDWNLTQLALSVSGKLMGLAAYGQVRPRMLRAFSEYYASGSLAPVNALVAEIAGDEPGRLVTIDEYVQKQYREQIRVPQISGALAADLAACNQRAFEDTFLEHALPLIEQYGDLPVCLAGGCSLNVLLNERLRGMIGNRIFVAPNTDDSGISLGQIFLERPPDERANVAYTGLPILDAQDLPHHTRARGGRRVSVDELCRLLRRGDIIGIVRGNSEVGPRALGNRSIVCDPSFPEMKDTINDIKRREWFRPFAPVVRREDADTYFHFDHDSSFMSFAPRVREQWRAKLPAITHADGTARLQTVSSKQNPFLHELLTRFGGVLLNTSFNIRGAPILTTIADAFAVLDETTLDHVLIEDTLFSTPHPRSEVR